jgi:hypothetical protein
LETELNNQQYFRDIALNAAGNTCNVFADYYPGKICRPSNKGLYHRNKPPRCTAWSSQRVALHLKTRGRHLNRRPRCRPAWFAPVTPDRREERQYFQEPKNNHFTLALVTRIRVLIDKKAAPYKSGQSMTRQTATARCTISIVLPVEPLTYCEKPTEPTASASAYPAAFNRSYFRGNTFVSKR